MSIHSTFQQSTYNIDMVWYETSKLDEMDKIRKSEILVHVEFILQNKN